MRVSETFEARKACCHHWQLEMGSFGREAVLDGRDRAGHKGSNLCIVLCHITATALGAVRRGTLVTAIRAVLEVFVIDVECFVDLGAQSRIIRGTGKG